MAVAAVFAGVVGILLVVLGLVGLLAPTRYHAMMHSRRPIAGLRVISWVEIVAGVVLVGACFVLLSGAFD
jgi:hypothetical protein